MIDINIREDITKALRKFGHLNQDELGKVTARAINRVVSTARTSAVREIRKTYNIDPKYFKDKIGDKDNRYNALKVWRASPRNLTGKLKAYGKPIPLIAFPVKQDATGVTVSVKKGKNEHIRSAFLATMRSGHQSVYGRGKYQKGAWAPRGRRVRPYPSPDLPINQFLTTSVRAAIVTPSVLAVMKAKVESDVGKRLEHEIAFLISKR